MTEPIIRDEWVEKAARAAFDDGFMRHAPEHVARWDDEHDEGVRESWRVIARAALAAVVDDIRADALRDLADEFETTTIQIVFDDPKSIDATRWDGMETSRKHAIRRMRDRADRIGGRHE